MVLATVIRLEMAYPGVGILAGDSLVFKYCNSSRRYNGFFYDNAFNIRGFWKFSPTHPVGCT